MTDRREYYAAYHARNRERRNAAALARYYARKAELDRDLRRIVRARIRRLRAALTTFGALP